MHGRPVRYKAAKKRRIIMKKMLFVFNPHSGKGQISSCLLEICDIFTKGGYEVTVHPTQAKNDGCNYITERWEDFDVIVCSGGDGMLNETIKSMMTTGCKKPLGYIPAGTMNDFASTLGISKDMHEAAKMIVESEPVAVDIGSFNDEYFTYIAAFGVFTAVSYETDQQLKNSLGVLAYIIEAVRGYQQEINKSYHMTIRYDDVEIEDDFLFGMIANSVSVGGIKGLAGNDVWLDDGIFEGLFIRAPKNFAEVQQTLTALIKHDLSAESLYYFKTGEVRITCDTAVPWTVDGEYGGDRKEVLVKNCHCAVNIISGENTVTGETKE